MKYIITESQKEIMKIIRRTQEDWPLIRQYVFEGIKEDYPCHYSKGEDFLNSVSKSSAVVYLFEYMDEKSYGTKTFNLLKDYITNIIKQRMGDIIIDHFNDETEDCE